MSEDNLLLLVGGEYSGDLFFIKKKKALVDRAFVYPKYLLTFLFISASFLPTWRRSLCGLGLLAHRDVYT